MKDILVAVGQYALFVKEAALWTFRRPFRLRLFLDEIEFVGNQSLSIVGLTAAFTGAVLAYQSYLAFVLVGTQSLVGASVGIALLRELAPVMTGIVVAGRAGGAMAAKLGIMRVSEQVDALEVMGISPQQYLVSPRIVAGMFATPLLVAIFSLIGCLGGYAVGVYLCRIDPGIYVEKMKFYMQPWDFYHGLLKSIVFGFLFSSIGCFKGYRASQGAEGVGRATNQAVVYSTVLILVVDYFLSILIPSGARVSL